MSNKPYDDAFKTLMYECPYLLVPIVNRLFRESWPRAVQVRARSAGRLDVRRRLEASVDSGRISSRSADIVLWLLDYVSRHLAKKQPEIAGRVKEMGGEVLEIPFLRERDAAEARAEAAEAKMNAAEARAKTAEARGMQQGRQLGMLDTLFGLVRDNMLTAQNAADRAKLSLAAFNAKMAEYEARPRA